MGTRRSDLFWIVLLSTLLLVASPAAAISDADQLWLVGSQAFNDQLYGLAQRMLERFILHHPEDPRVPTAVLLLAKSRLALGALEAALQGFRQARRLPTPPGEPGEVDFWEGETLFRLKRYAEAQAAYGAVLREPSPWAPNALYGLGWAALQQNQPEEAVRTFRRLLADWPTHATAAAASYQLARTLADLNRPAEAGAVLVGYETLYPDSPWLAEALYLRGWSQLSTGEPEGATRTFESFLARAPTHELAPQAQLHLAEALVRRGRGAEAEQAWRRLQAEYPQHPLVHRAGLELARVAFDQQRYAEAEVQASSATASTDPQVRLEAHLLAGESLLRLKRYSAALQAFKTALEVSPAGDPLRLRALAGLGLTHERLRQWGEAARHYQLLANSQDEVLKKWAAERLKAIKAQRQGAGGAKSSGGPRDRPANRERPEQR